MIIEYSSYLGSLMILLAFVLNLNGRLDVSNYKYLLLNIIGCGITSVYAFSISEWSLFILQIAWFAFTLIKIIQKLKGTK